MKKRFLKNRFTKRIFFISLLFINLNLMAQDQAKMCFLKQTIDLGEFVCKEDSIVKINFIFSNEGNTPLVVYKAVASCGCVKPKWPKNPIKKGEKSIICIEFDTKNRLGVFSKDIYVESNSVKSIMLLKIKGNVKKK